MRVVYIDELFLFNSFVDFVLLMSTGRITGLPYKKVRIAAAAIGGGIYAVAARLAPDTAAAWPAFRILTGALIPLCAFGYSSWRAFARRTAVFWAASALFGGVSIAMSGICGSVRIDSPFISINPSGMAVMAFALCGLMLSSTAFSGAAVHKATELARLEIRYLGRETQATALIDTGNTLRDPLSGLSVIVAEPEAVRPLFDARAQSALMRSKTDAASALEALAGTQHAARFRLVPCRTAGGETMLAAFRPDKVTLGGKNVNALVALAVSPIGEGGAFAAIAGNPDRQ